jgi:hypothetical protein
VVHDLTARMQEPQGTERMSAVAVASGRSDRLNQLLAPTPPIALADLSTDWRTPPTVRFGSIASRA